MPRQLSGYGRIDWSTKLIRGLTSEAPAGFQSRRGRGHESAPVTLHYAAFPTYKAPRVHHAARWRRGGVAAGSARAAGRADAAHRRAQRDQPRRSGMASPRCGVPRRVCRNRAGSSAATFAIDYRWELATLKAIRRHAAELIALAPDVILASGGRGRGNVATGDPHCADRVHAVTDPVGAGFVDSLARPGGNATGFTSIEYGISAKWPELLREIAPRVTRAAVLRDPTIPQGIGQFAVIQSAAPPLGMELTPVSVRDAGEIERAVTEFARSSNGGLIVPGSALALVHRDLIIALAARQQTACGLLRALLRHWRRPALLRRLIR